MLFVLLFCFACRLALFARSRSSSLSVLRQTLGPVGVGAGSWPRRTVLHYVSFPSWCGIHIMLVRYNTGQRRFYFSRPSCRRSRVLSAVAIAIDRSPIRGSLDQGPGLQRWLHRPGRWRGNAGPLANGKVAREERSDRRFEGRWTTRRGQR